MGELARKIGLSGLKRARYSQKPPSGLSQVTMLKPISSKAYGLKFDNTTHLEEILNLTPDYNGWREKGGEVLVTKRDLVIAILTTFSLTVTILAIMPSRSLPGSAEYDPWADTDDSGTINIVDVVNVAKSFGTSGQPLVKTALLVGHVNASKVGATLSTDYVQMANMSLNIDLNRKSYLIVMFSAVVGVLTGGDMITVRALVNESIASPGEIVFFPEISRTADHTHWLGFTPHTYNFLQLAERGNYTIKIEWKASEGGGAYVSARTLIVMAIPA